MEMLYKTFKAQTIDSKDGVIKAIVSVFSNVDNGNERVLPGAFKNSLKRKLPKGVWMHDWKQTVAKTLVARELMPGDPLLPPELSLLGGLYIEGAFNLNTQRGKEAFSDIDFGIVDEFSIGYQNEKTAYDEKTGVLDLVEVNLYEWSPVLYGMNSATVLLEACLLLYWISRNAWNLSTKCEKKKTALYPRKTSTC
jgi:HK97 family phage prohead protease